jgi:hypothetical protein
VWRDHLDAVSAQLLVQGIAVVGAVTDQILRLGFDHAEVEAQLHPADFVMVGRMSCLPIAGNVLLWKMIPDSAPIARP